jgi:glycerol kinase
VGLWKDEEEVADLWRAERTFAPDPAVDREALLAGWRTAVGCVRDLADRTA